MLKPRCNVCGKRDTLYLYAGMKMCSGCKSTMKQCDNQKSPEQPKYSGVGEVMQRSR